MTAPQAETIFALSSGGLPSGVAVIRLSGPRTADVITHMTGGLPAPRRAALRTIRDGDGERLDQGLVLFFPAPFSFTGEDCGELHLHGGRAVVQATLDCLAGFDGLRLADAGEFSRRAFAHGKLDLIEVEGLADLLAAETEMQRRLAGEQAAGGLSSLYSGWAKRLTHARAMIEAELDFADEDDVPGSVAERIWPDMALLYDEIQRHLTGSATATIIRDGYRIVIAGEPNAGKSSLLNALAKRDIAIVTDVAGTTRDVLEVDLSLAGFMVKLIDTAGLRDTEDQVEREGIRRARARIADADLVLLLADHPNGFNATLDTQAPILKLGTKLDRDSAIWDSSAADLTISVEDGTGLDRLIDMIQRRLPRVHPGALALPARRRHQDLLRQCAGHIRSSLDMSGALDLQAEYLRLAQDILGRLTGRVDVEHLLDVIFSEFCIGK
ncbi:tRNA uridine-5-carboxymethylaminomethyl(34) synthesis GTPase MnmE [Xaviernesmea oryzae]|uniref:tRNA modification GTPase MnmE n=1 Tax=Xaviernesmea oryzae TaxID=464029 RepID=A0A1Q9AY60_9HYPH|nr:tRNA uridine-5-carboxymethylaminomethyl(34) synthesis GTPase MnmE [Xaviernesmea oryzae]OLP60402.1 tRNA uridine-5-carboxymethylaminomethyl(34) synthesis GTPase MnmE [Xaviernesmea oryzae]SEK19911.1 tRNA modification GTPase [Xaviernesmea oryzae]